MLLALALTLVAADPAAFCDEKPTAGASVSRGSPSSGSLDGGAQLVESAHVRVLPLRHKARCLSWGTRRLVEAIARAGDRVATERAGSPALGVGNIGRPRGGPIAAYSHSHHAGRDADLAFYLVDASGAPVFASDLVKLDASLQGVDAAGARVHLDVARTWALCAALLEDASVDVQWLFVSNAIRAALLREAQHVHAKAPTLARAQVVLHQPSDAPPHDDHVHLRIRCTPAEVAGGCR